MSEENKALARRILEELVVKMNMDNLEEYFAPMLSSMFHFSKCHLVLKVCGHSMVRFQMR
jgi:hypothetical protein